jgi:hypothetical protein
MAPKQPRGFVGQVRGVSHHGQENELSTNRPDTLTQTFFIQNFSLAVGRRTIQLTNFDSVSTPPARMIGLRPTLGNRFSGGIITLHWVAALSVNWVADLIAASTFRLTLRSKIEGCPERKFNAATFSPVNLETT